MKQNKLIEVNVEPYRVFQPFETEDIESFSLPANFPNCCELHIERLKNITALVKNELNSEKDNDVFKKEKFGNLPAKIIRQVELTFFKITELFDEDDWYKLIEDYLEYNISAFGGIGWGQITYKNIVYSNIEMGYLGGIEIPIQKKKKLLEYFEREQVSKDELLHSINALDRTYQKWLSVFPFDIPFFEPLREKYSSDRMSYIAISKRNKYLDYPSYTLKKESILLNELKEITENTLASINTTELFINGKLNQRQTLEYAIEDNNHAIKQKILLNQFLGSEKEYADILSMWLSNEIAHIQKLKKRFPQPKNKRTNPPKKDITFLQLFRGDEQRTNKVFDILRSDKLQAIDNDNNWVYLSFKSSIVACFQALEDLEIIRKGVNKAELHRVISSKITFEGNIKLFRNGCKSEDRNEFAEAFKALKS